MTPLARLIVAPHVDDDVIGCGGLLSMYGKSCMVMYLGVDERHVVGRRQRFQEADAVARATGHLFLWPVREGGEHPETGNGSSYEANRTVNCYEVQSIIRDLEWAIQKWQPQEVYLPWPSYNQDHQTTYRAAMVALRPSDYLPFVPRVFLYEEPDCFWPGAGEPFKPTFFRTVDPNAKLRLYGMMKSQVRGHRSPEHLSALMTVRGAAIMKPAAEAYHVLRMAE